MSIYIAPFKNEHQIFDKPLSPTVELCQIFYKQKEGPLGFLIDDKSKSVFEHIINGTIWSDKLKNKFHIMNDDFLKKNIFKLRGLFVESTSWIQDEMALEKTKLLNEAKNRIRLKYKKTLLPESATLFSFIFGGASEKYNSELIYKIEKNNVNFLLLGHTEFGRYLITQTNSIFIKKLENICTEFNENIYNVSDISLIPSW